MGGPILLIYIYPWGFSRCNIFLSNGNGKYSIIDWALARNDGFLFYDQAYLEISLLLNKLGSESLANWRSIIEQISRDKTEELDNSTARIVGHIHQAELAWIINVNNAEFSHMDKMRIGRITARVMAGLNYCGKRTVDDSLRDKAIVFSCIYLKRLLDLLNEDDWKSSNEVFRWNWSARNSDTSQIRPFVNFCGNFTEEYQYILICGTGLHQDPLINEHLARIPWRGIMSLSTRLDEPLIQKLKEYRSLRLMGPRQSSAETGQIIQNCEAWWYSVNGNSSDPEFTTRKYADWRNRFGKIIQRTVETICSAAQPQELMIIVAIDSLMDSDELRQVNYILPFFDADESGNVKVALMDPKNVAKIYTDDYINITPTPFKVSMEILAEYTADYLPGRCGSRIWLPQKGRYSGIQLDETDNRYISTYLEVVGEHLLRPDIKDSALRTFYLGEPISWDAIDRQLAVDRPEINELIEKIIERIKNEEWGRLDLPHTPGSGASVLIRMACWQLWKRYPVLVIKKICGDTFKGVSKIASVTGLPLIVILDGDYSRSEAESVEKALGSDITSRKYVLIFVYRSYRADDSDLLSVLSIPLAERFKSRYIDEMEHLDRYTPAECERRERELNTLTMDTSLAEFRLPFFYGMYAFQNDFANMSIYIEQILNRARSDQKFMKIISYLAIVTFYTAEDGLSYKITKKLMGLSDKSMHEIRIKLNEDIPALVYSYKSRFRICHPIIAREILIRLYGDDKHALSSEAFCNLCKDFIINIRKCEPAAIPPLYINQLISNIFIVRSLDDHVVDSPDSSRSMFATIILDINNPNLQEDVFQCLVDEFPQNDLCHQHYGRLLSYHSPGDMTNAKCQFDQAIEIDRNNPTHYHARGTMYQRYCSSRLRDFNLSTPEEIFSNCKYPVERALEDFNDALKFGQNYITNEGLGYDPAYPYSSILNICTFIVSKIKQGYEYKYPKGTTFFESDSEASRWCLKLISAAKRVKMSASQEHPELSRNDFYSKAQEKLETIELSDNGLKKLIDRRADDIQLKIIYLSRYDIRHEILKSRSQDELERAFRYCESVIENVGADSGVLWKWFNIYIHMNSFNEAHALGLLEMVPGAESSITANYLLYVLYFCKFYRTKNKQDANKSLFYCKRCRELSTGTIIGSHRRSCMFFLSDSQPLPITDYRGNSVKLECTLVENIAQEQTAHMTLNLEPRFQVVFVPWHSKNLKLGQGLGTVVNCEIGFSYNGLYGFNLETE